MNISTSITSEGGAGQPLILNPSNRIRRSPVFDKVQAAGAKAWSIYNGTMIGQWFGTLADDCAHLKRAVQLWDVGGERIVEIKGPGAQRLLQMTTPRDLWKVNTTRCAYIPMVDSKGRLLNDPVLVRLADDRFWIALADSDMYLFLKGLAAGSGLDVEISDPDVWILALQGPLADDVAERVWGPSVRDIPFFGHAPVPVEGRDMVLARTGWSLQGGFELYVEGSENLPLIWDRLFAAGQDFDIRVGCPNLIERIEGGLLSYGNDMTEKHTPMEAGLGRHCVLDRDVGCLGYEALVAQREPARQVRPVDISGGPVPSVAKLWEITDQDGNFAGRVSSAVWSPDQQGNVAIAMIERAYWDAGTKLIVHASDGPRDLTVRARYWIGRHS
ncbi:MAG: dimethylsulfoniopropionate demethylase [Pseudomonadota bacterium]